MRVERRPLKPAEIDLILDLTWEGTIERSGRGREVESLKEIGIIEETDPDSYRFTEWGEIVGRIARSAERKGYLE